jgi:5-methylcytosine-specific restriction endonuclease McrA
MPRKSIPRSQLSPEALAAERAKERAYKARNRAKVNARNRAKHQANPAIHRAAQQRYHAKHHEEILAKKSAERAQRKSLTGTTCHPSQQRYRERNRARLLAKVKQYRKDHPEVVSAQDARRRWRERNALINDFTAQEWRALCKAVGYRCCYCGKKFPAKELEPDHLTPYAKDGNNTLHNILPCCAPCNQHKSAGKVLRPVQPFLLLDAGAAD